MHNKRKKTNAVFGKGCTGLCIEMEDTYVKVF